MGRKVTHFRGITFIFATQNSNVMKKIIFIAAALCALACNEAPQGGFPELNQNGKIAIVAHRGFWNCEEAGYAQNTIASLRLAQEAGVWGSEFDVQLTADNVAIVNHDADIQGLKIADHTYAELVELSLNNGEHVSTIDQYFEQGAKCATTMLVCELKSQSSPEREDILTDLCVASAKAHGVFDPSRMIFITFSHYMCQRIANEYPEFVNQYLNGELSAEELKAEGINGLDYNSAVIDKNPEWVTSAHANGMSVNVWTVNDEEKMKVYSEMGVDAITTNEPLLAREVLGEKEFKLQ